MLHTAPTRPILLLTLAGAVASIAVCAAAFQRLGAAPFAVPQSGADEAPQGASNHVQADDFARVECKSGTPAIALDDEWAPPHSATLGVVTSAKERDLRAAFVALERAEPGSLTDRANALLSGNGPTPEKVALLRALRDTASPATAHWLDFTIRKFGDANDVRAQALSTFALEQLAELAGGDSGAGAALHGLAFDSAGVAVELRRRASAAFAAACPLDDLSELSSQLWRERDELVIASVLSALEPRRSEPQVQGLLAVHGRPRCETNPDEAECPN